VLTRARMDTNRAQSSVVQLFKLRMSGILSSAYRHPID
jgi:hypothetical protein